MIINVTVGANPSSDLHNVDCADAKLNEFGDLVLVGAVIKGILFNQFVIKRETWKGYSLED